MKGHFSIGTVLICQMAMTLVGSHPCLALESGSPSKISSEDYLKWRAQKRLSENAWMGPLGKGSNPPSSNSNPSSIKDALTKGAELGSDIQFIASQMKKAEMDQFLHVTHMEKYEPILVVKNSLGKDQKVGLMGNDWRIKSIAATLKMNQDRANLDSVYKTVVSTFNSSKSEKAAGATLPEISATDSLEVAQSKMASIARILKALQNINLRHLVLNKESQAKSESPSSVNAPSLFSFDWPLKSFLSNVKDQGVRATGTSFAIVGGIESLLKKLGRDIDLSEQALHFQAKAFFDRDGAEKDELLTHLVLSGAKNSDFRIPLEKVWNYNPSLSRQADFSGSCGSEYKEFCSDTPSQGKWVCAQVEGSSHCGLMRQGSSEEGVRVQSYEAIWDPRIPDESAHLAIHYLQSGIPLICDTVLTESFLKSKEGVVNLSPKDESPIAGGQSLLMVGYLPASVIKSKVRKLLDPTSEGYFILKNSMGTALGDGGYFYASMGYIKKFTLSLIAVKEADFGKGEEGPSGSVDFETVSDFDEEVRPKNSTIEDFGNLGNIF